MNPGGAPDREVRARIYEHFAATGKAPTVEGLALALELPPPAIQAALKSLAEARQIVLDPASGGIWMAHPFSAIPTSFPVQTATGDYWANCAWDALGIAALLGVDASTRTHCAEGGDPITIEVRAGEVEPKSTVVHFLVPPTRFWQDIGFT